MLNGERRFRSLIDYTSDIIAVLEEDMTICYESPSVERVLGYRADEMVGSNAMDYVHPDDVERIRGRFAERVEKAGVALPLEVRIRHADCGWRDMEVLSNNLLEDPEIQGIVINARDITLRKQMERELWESEARFRSIFEQTAVGISIADLDRRLLETNPAYQEMVGYTGEELFGREIAEFTHPDDLSTDAELHEELLAGKVDRYQREKRYIRRDGELVWVSATVSVVRDEKGVPQFLIGVVEDITERKLAAEALVETERRFRQLFENFPDALFVHDEKGRLLDCNTEACRALGYSREELLALTVGDFSVALISEEEKRLRKGETLWERAMWGEPGRVVGFDQNELRRKDGTTFPVEVGVGAIDYGGRRAIFATVRDVTAHKELEGELVQQAFHDPLTRLPNRALFTDRLEQALSRSERREGVVAVLFLDLDDFKAVNDSLGHEAGDQLLISAARRLSSCVRPGDTVARLAGDEFTVLLEDIGHEREAALVAERIVRGFETPFWIKGRQIDVTLSLGIATGGVYDAPAELLRRADLAMYRAKESGKAHYEIHGPDMLDREGEGPDVAADLRNAVERGEFEIHYQPRVRLRDGRIVGVEALIRWEHPEHGLIYPGEFVQLAEKLGLTSRVQQWVLREALGRAREWRTLNPECSHLIVGVNLHPRLIRRPELAGEIEEILRETGTDPRELELEVPESALAGDPESIVAGLGKLKGLEVRLAIDDFGSGFASVPYLRRLPINALKIDSPFTAGLGHSLEETMLVSGAIGIARSLGLETVAEGVETAEQLHSLLELECEFAQGYHFYGPLPAGEITSLLSETPGQ